MKDFSSYHKMAGPAPAGFAPKSGDLVSAKFSDGQWYRAKVRKSSAVKKEAQVTFIDYGNQDTVGFKDIRPLDPRFRSLPGQAHEARMRLVTPIFMSSKSVACLRLTMCSYSFILGSTLFVRLSWPLASFQFRQAGCTGE